MSINSYIENEKKYYEVYVNGYDGKGRRIQRRKKGIETLRKAELAEFEFKRELHEAKSGRTAPTWSNWLEACIERMRLKIFLREARATNHRFYSIWFVALATGMRSGELMALSWTDVDLEARTITVSRQWTSKTGFAPTKTQRSRVVPIANDLAQFLRELRIKRGNEEFVLPHLREWQNGEQAKVTREFCAAIGVTPVKFHDLRATFITNLLSRGVSLAQVMSVVGHNQLKTTNSYLRKAGVEVRGVTEKLGYKLPDAPKTARIFQFANEL